MDRKTFLVIGLFILGITGTILYLRRDMNISPQRPLGAEIPKLTMLKMGEEAPDIELKDDKGVLHRLKDYRGKVVLINFWASWCPPCLTEMPSLASTYQKLKDQGFEILAINLDEDIDAMNHFLKAEKLPFKILLDPDGKSAQTYLVYGLPYTVLLDRQGRVKHKVFGGHDWDQGKPFEKIKSLL